MAERGGGRWDVGREWIEDESRGWEADRARPVAPPAGRIDGASGAFRDAGAVQDTRGAPPAPPPATRDPAHGPSGAYQPSGSTGETFGYGSPPAAYPPAPPAHAGPGGYPPAAYPAPPPAGHDGRYPPGVYPPASYAPTAYQPSAGAPGGNQPAPYGQAPGGYQPAPYAQAPGGYPPAPYAQAPYRQGAGARAGQRPYGQRAEVPTVDAETDTGGLIRPSRVILLVALIVSAGVVIYGFFVEKGGLQIPISVVGLVMLGISLLLTALASLRGGLRASREGSLMRSIVVPVFGGLCALGAAGSLATAFMLGTLFIR
jgi:hypothetical protein